MKRPILFTAGTLAGLATVLAAHASTRPPLLTGAGDTTTATAAGGGQNGTGSTIPGPSAGTAGTPTPVPATAASGPASAAPSRRTINGRSVKNPYGSVRVRLIITGHTITDVRPLSLPNADGHSRKIAAKAVPLLRQQVLSAQSAKINGVSGATYTSNGYARSVQSALDSIGGRP